MLFVEVLAVLILTLVNGFFAMSEFAVISSRRGRLDILARKGSAGARAALKLADNPSRFLSTVQIGITLVGIFAGAFSGATLGRRLGEWLDSFSVISPYGNAIGIGVTVVAITYISLILGELVPKRIALAKPERIASVVARPMRGLSIVASPAVWLLNVSTEGVLHLFRISGKRDTAVTEEEVKSLVAEGTKTGIFAPQEKEMIEGVLRLADRPVRVIMTPRSHVVWVDSEARWNSILNVVESNRFSRFLVCDGTIDNPLGYVHSKDILPEALRGTELDIETLMKPLLCIPEHVSVLDLLNRFKSERTHLAVVIDEHGATDGIATIADVLEAIAGDMPEVDEEAGPQILKRDDGSWLVDGMMLTDEVEAVTDIQMGAEVMTVAGFVLCHLGHIPEPGTSIAYGNARFEIVDMDGNRIDKVLIYAEAIKPED